MDPLNLVAQMVCENGVRWGDQATSGQWADMRALLSMERPMYHMWLRPRGGSKTWDAGAATVAVMLTRAGPGDEMYAAANGKDQAGLLALKIASIVRNTPQLASAVEVQQHAVIAPSTGAVLQVLSSETPGAWGKTPLWMFLDEMCNWENTPVKREFATSLLTSLPKRPDSTCLIGSTPSWTGHWSHDRWERVLRSARRRGLWRPSHTPGPAPWQDPEELEEQREDLLDHEWRRLFLCEWAAADDAVADAEALDACTRGAPDVLPPDGSAQYVVAWDIGWKKDHSAVVVAHLGERDGRKVVIVDRLDSWIPGKGTPVDIGAVLDHAARMSGEYGGAQMRGDPTEAEMRIQQLSEAGYDIRAADTGAAANSVRYKHLLRLLRDRALEIPADEQLRREILSLRLAESTTPGIVRLASDGSARGHFDRVAALCYAIGQLLGRSGMNYRAMAPPGRECQACGRWTLQRAAACTNCRAPNPAAPETLPGTTAAAVVPLSAAPGGFLAAALGGDGRKCGACGYVWSVASGDRPCPRCHAGRGAAAAMPAAFSRALAIGRRIA